MEQKLGDRLRQARQRADMTLRALAREIGISASFMSQIENGKSQPSVATLYEIARTLNISIDDLFNDTDTETVTDVAASDGYVTGIHAWEPSALSSLISVIHPAHRATLEMAAGVRWERLAATPERGIVFMKIIYSLGATSTNGGVSVGRSGYEYGYILKGTLEITIGPDSFTLNAGESIGFDASIPHSLRNAGNEDMQAIWVIHRAHQSPP